MRHTKKKKKKKKTYSDGQALETLEAVVADLHTGGLVLYVRFS